MPCDILVEVVLCICYILVSEKAFNSVCYYKLLESLLRSSVPDIVVGILYNWYCKVYYHVMCNGGMYASFSVDIGITSW